MVRNRIKQSFPSEWLEDCDQSRVADKLIDQECKGLRGKTPKKGKTTEKIGEISLCRKDDYLENKGDFS